MRIFVAMILGVVTLAEVSFAGRIKEDITDTVRSVVTTLPGNSQTPFKIEVINEGTRDVICNNITLVADLVYDGQDKYCEGLWVHDLESSLRISRKSTWNIFSGYPLRVYRGEATGDAACDAGFKCSAAQLQQGICYLKKGRLDPMISCQ